VEEVTVDGKEGAQLLIGFLQGKGEHFLFWAFVLGLVMLVAKKFVPPVYEFMRDGLKLLWHGFAWVIAQFLNFAVNFVASALMLLVWAVACGLIYGWYLGRLLIATIRETREPPTPEFPTAFGWIRLLPIKKPKNAGHGGGHH
jgi:hypothetical protein